MRVLFVPFAIATLSACGSIWVITDDVPLGTCGDPLPSFYVDDDGDGWGDPHKEPEARCEGDVVTGYTARNSRDCDDADSQVTGRIGSVCPENLVFGGSSYVGLVRGAREYVAVTAPTHPVWPASAAGACGDWGWGGDLATFDSVGDLTELQNSLEGESSYAAHVGLVSDGAAWGWSDGATMDIVQIPPCSTLPDPAQAGPDDRLAIVKRGAGDWCLGLPGDLGQGADDAGYGRGHAHFVCGRSIPDPDDFVEAAGSGGDGAR